MRNVLDDDKIIGALRAEIRQASYIPTATARKPEEYEWELEQLRIESAAKADYVSDIEVVEYQPRKERKPKRVPRLWWGWTLLLWKEIRALPPFGRLLLLLMAVVLLLWMVL